MVEPFDPCCLRFSSLVVEKISMKRSKSSTCVVASSISSLLFPELSLVSALFVPRSGGEDRGADEAFLWIDRAEVLDDLEAATASLCDVHVQPQVVLAGHHRRGSTGAFGDLGMVEGGDHVVLVERARFRHGGGPEPQPAVQPGAGTATGELRT